MQKIKTLLDIRISTLAALLKFLPPVIVCCSFRPEQILVDSFVTKAKIMNVGITYIL